MHSKRFQIAALLLCACTSTHPAAVIRPAPRLDCVGCKPDPRLACHLDFDPARNPTLFVKFSVRNTTAAPIRLFLDGTPFGDPPVSDEHLIVRCEGGPVVSIQPPPEFDRPPELWEPHYRDLGVGRTLTAYSPLLHRFRLPRGKCTVTWDGLIADMTDTPPTVQRSQPDHQPARLGCNTVTITID